MKITATTHNEFFVDTGEITEDGRFITHRCFLDGNILRTVPCKHGEIDVFLPIKIVLGPASFAKVTALKLNQTIALA